MIELEKRLQNIEDKIKSTKTALPVAGSLVDSYLYSEEATKTYGYGVLGSWSVTFTPDDPSLGPGIIEIGVLVEANSTAADLVPSNPQYVYAQNGFVTYSQETLKAYSDGYVFYANSDYPDDGYIAKITANVFSTIPGEVQITLI